MLYTVLNPHPGLASAQDQEPGMRWWWWGLADDLSQLRGTVPDVQKSSG